MNRDQDFQLYERVRLNLQRRRRQIRWGLFAINLTCFVLYAGFVALALNDEFGRHYLMNSFHDTARWTGHILWIPLLLWFFTLVIHFVSIIIESGRFDKTLAARAKAEEERILDEVLRRLSEAEKRKRDVSHLEDRVISDEEQVAFHRMIEEQAAHG